MRSGGRILLVETDDIARSRLEAAAASLGQLESHHRFETARARLYGAPFDLLVTNVRLGAYNGLHLVYLSSSAPGAPRSIVYSEKRDSGLAREVQRAGAFYEVGAQLPVTLAAYVAGTLPDHDRRDPSVSDRRRQFRGGRRCWDLHYARAGEAGTPQVELSSM
jgi:DNA-binding NtrC family response regulator